MDLTSYWKKLEARVTHMVHSEWQALSFHASMFSRYSHTVYHNAALGRGPFRAIVHRDAEDDNLRKCRYGCCADETLEHILLECSFVEDQRRCLKKSLVACHEELTISAALGEMKVSEDCEKLFASFFRIFES